MDKIHIEGFREGMEKDAGKKKLTTKLKENPYLNPALAYRRYKVDAPGWPQYKKKHRNILIGQGLAGTAAVGGAGAAGAAVAGRDKEASMSSIFRLSKIKAKKGLAGLKKSYKKGRSGHKPDGTKAQRAAAHLGRNRDIYAAGGAAGTLGTGIGAGAYALSDDEN